MIDLTPAQEAAHDAMQGMIVKQYGHEASVEIARAVVDAIAALPVEQRMEAMGMVRRPALGMEIDAWMEADRG